ncbi:DUF3945 domain-containing protein [Hymenobacter sp. YC55]|uniref:DUF4099 domain-containing protein n=1 Tax=Hymenobacter sp. YC55 TaxID=3034019 RepID=UPI0023F8729B|nr:DUF3945 domain-containing protein [Hymenobacter sp. YC55]MDF7815116.1 DUF3945 domain-containing protein [Hymenobacter sp. YC55]
MSQETEPPVGSGGSFAPRLTGSATEIKKPATINIDETRDDFINNAQPVADALRKRGKQVEATQLEQAAKVIGVAVGTRPLQQNNALQGESVSQVLKSIWEVIEKDPELRKMPQAQNLRKAGQALDGAGLLNITVRNGVVVSFVSNFVDNFSQAHKAGQKPSEKPNPDVMLESSASAARIQQPQTVSDRPAPIGQQASPPVHVSTEKMLEPTSHAAAPAGVQPRPQEVIYVNAPPLPDGKLLHEVLGRQKEHYSLYQLQVDPRDANKAIMLPASGADGMIINALASTTGSCYSVVGKPDADKQFLEVKSPTRLERTADGWRVTEKGTVGFRAAPSTPQAPAQQQAADLQPAPAVQEKVASLLSPAVRAQAQALAEQNLANRRGALAQPKGFTIADIPFNLLAKMGVQAADLEKSGQLQKLLEGKKTDLIPSFVIRNLQGEPVPFAAKLVLHRDADGVATLRFDLPKHRLEIPKQIMGKDITPLMKEQLQQVGVVLADGLKDGKGQPFTGYLTVDKEMNKVVAVPRAGFEVPKVLHGVTLKPDQRQELLEGRPLQVEGMISNNRSFDATLQLDPLKRTISCKNARFYEPAKQEMEQMEGSTRRGVRI